MGFVSILLSTFDDYVVRIYKLNSTTLQKLKLKLSTYALSNERAIKALGRKLSIIWNSALAIINFQSLANLCSLTWG